jgi:hypothetical protein
MLSIPMLDIRWDEETESLVFKWGARMTKVSFQGHSGWLPIQLPSGLLIFYSL